MRLCGRAWKGGREGRACECEWKDVEFLLHGSSGQRFIYPPVLAIGVYSG
jgi:hypothetical protein